jgi:hypothetical protein
LLCAVSEENKLQDEYLDDALRCLGEQMRDAGFVDMAGGWEYPIKVIPEYAALRK